MTEFDRPPEDGATNEEQYVPVGYYARVLELEKDWNEASAKGQRDRSVIDAEMWQRKRKLEAEADSFLAELVAPYSPDAPIEQRFTVETDGRKVTLPYTEGEVMAIRLARTSHEEILGNPSGQIVKDYLFSGIAYSFPEEVKTQEIRPIAIPNLEEQRPESVLALFKIARAAEEAMYRSRHNPLGREPDKYRLFQTLIRIKGNLIKHPLPPQRKI